MSADPAMGDYLPGDSVNDAAKEHNEKLPGMRGVLNLVNLAVFNYAGNNPLKYTDPNGSDVGNPGRDEPSKNYTLSTILRGTIGSKYVHNLNPGRANGMDCSAIPFCMP